MKKTALGILIIVVCVVLAFNVALAKQKFYGTVDSMPPSGVGEWVIGGKTVVAVRDTIIKQKHGTIQEGSYVQVEAIFVEGKYVATEIEYKRKK
jgi:hypothetical protein